MPEVSEGVPIGAGVGGWGTLSTLKNWTLVNAPQRGDIVAARDPIDNTYHVGIFISAGTTISTNPIDISRSNWPFGTGSEEGEDIRYWNYCGLEENCPWREKGKNTRGATDNKTFTQKGFILFYTSLLASLHRFTLFLRTIFPPLKKLCSNIK